MDQTMICINCPRGCHLSVSRDADGSWQVTGNRCPRGRAYAIQEQTDPRRIVTAVVRTDNADVPYLPVRSSKPFPKPRIHDLLNRLYDLTVRTPVQRGDVILTDDDTGITVVASESIG